DGRGVGEGPARSCHGDGEGSTGRTAQGACGGLAPGNARRAARRRDAGRRRGGRQVDGPGEAPARREAHRGGRGRTGRKGDARRVRGEREVRAARAEELHWGGGADVALAEVPAAPDVFEELDERIMNERGARLVGRLRGGADEGRVYEGRIGIPFVERQHEGGPLAAHRGQELGHPVLEPAVPRGHGTRVHVVAVIRSEPDEVRPGVERRDHFGAGAGQEVRATGGVAGDRRVGQEREVVFAAGRIQAA